MRRLIAVNGGWETQAQIRRGLEPISTLGLKPSNFWTQKCLSAFRTATRSKATLILKSFFGFLVQSNPRPVTSVTWRTKLKRQTADR